MYDRDFDMDLQNVNYERNKGKALELNVAHKLNEENDHMWSTDDHIIFAHNSADAAYTSKWPSAAESFFPVRSFSLPFLEYDAVELEL